MKPEPTEDNPLDDPKFQSLLVLCLEKLERGEELDCAQFLKSNPEYSAELDGFLSDHRMLRRVGGEIRDVGSENETVIRETSEKHRGPANGLPDVGSRIRYVGEYELLNELGRGGMGVVYRARQEKLSRLVALKMLLAGQLADLEDVKRFQREARAAGQLKHPNIVPIHETGQHNDVHYIAMDYIEGNSLADELKDQTMAPQAAAKLIKTVAEAIQFAHDHGTIHRDLKPANILLDRKKEPHITDFGLAKLNPEFNPEARSVSPTITLTGQILGTPAYMSPEQAAGKTGELDHSTDIYSLGAVLFTCLTGQPPFVANTPVDTLFQVIDQPATSPRIINPDLSRDLEKICLKCLEKKSSERYSSAQDLADDLERYLNHQPVQARPLPVLTRVYRWCDRNIGLFTSAMVLFLLMMPAIVFFGMGFLFDRWPLILLLYSYPLMLAVLSPYVLAMIFYGKYYQWKRKHHGQEEPTPSDSISTFLFILGCLLIAGALGGYVWVFSNHGWNFPSETKLLAVVLILGVGAIINGVVRRR